MISLAPGERRVALLVSGIGLALFAEPSEVVPESFDAQGEDFVEILASEETILSLTPSLKRFGTDVLSLQLPNHAGMGLFAEQVIFNDLADSQLTSGVDLPGEGGVRWHEWSVSDTEQSVPSSELDLWRPFLDQVEYVERGNFLDAQRDRWEADIAFSGVARKEA